METDKTTEQLNKILKHIDSDQLEQYFTDHAKQLINSPCAFAEFFRGRMKEKNMRFQEVFLQADISEGYGYKLISGEKHTRQRDVIIRLCLGARFSLEDTQQALRLYGFSPLYARVPRDAVLIVAIHTGQYEMERVGALLLQYGMVPLYSSREA